VAIVLIGTSSILGAINFLVTIVQDARAGDDAVPACRSWSWTML
jgi:heme/copper-type cytochrome/quinol oxidase subunit 1